MESVVSKCLEIWLNIRENYFEIKIPSTVLKYPQ